MDEAWRGSFDAAAALIAETDAIAEATGSRLPPYAAMFLGALRGRPAQVAALVRRPRPRPRPGDRARR